LCRAKRDGCVLAALGARGAGFDASVVLRGARRGRGAKHGRTLGLTSLTALGFVFEPFVVKKQLFPGGKDEIGTAVDAGQYLVLKFH